MDLYCCTLYTFVHKYNYKYRTQTSKCISSDAGATHKKCYTLHPPLSTTVLLNTTLCHTSFKSLRHISNTSKVLLLTLEHQYMGRNQFIGWEKSRVTNSNTNPDTNLIQIKRYLQKLPLEIRILCMRSMLWVLSNQLDTNIYNSNTDKDKINNTFQMVPLALPYQYRTSLEGNTTNTAAKQSRNQFLDQTSISTKPWRQACMCQIQKQEILSTWVWKPTLFRF